MRETASELKITPELIAEYLAARESDGLPPETVSNYRRKLQQLYDLLPEDKTLRPGLLLTVAKRLEAEGYSKRTVNVFLSTAEGMLAYFEKYDLQAHARREVEASIQPELTRSEYLRLLAAAKIANKPRAYFLIKTFATLGLNTQELELLTVEALQDGYIRSGDGVIRIPASFGRDLQSYARANGVYSGPVFVTRTGKPILRTNFNVIMASVQQEARVSPEKCNPSCLRRLYQRTQAELQDRLRLLMEQEYDRLLAQEDHCVGWEEKSAGAYARSAAERTARAGTRAAL